MFVSIWTFLQATMLFQAFEAVENLYENIVLVDVIPIVRCGNY